MFIIKQPSKIILGRYSASETDFPNNCLLITSKGAHKRGWIEYINLENYSVFDQVENNPSIETAEKIISEFSGHIFQQSLVWAVEVSWTLQNIVVIK